MKILYGVVGEGMGHAMRSRVTLEHLVAAGHDIEIMASGRATDFLAKRFDGVNRIHGLHMIYEENRVRRGRTLWSNVIGGVTGVPENIAAYFDLVGDFRPEVVVSDFESWTYLYAKTHRLPILSIDNMQIIHRCALPDEVVPFDKGWMLASSDPVALDTACADMINAQPVNPNSVIAHEHEHLHDHFTAAHPDTDWRAAVACLACFVLTLALQRVVPAT